VLGVLFGWAAPEYAVRMQPLADIFLRMIKMIIAPLIFSTLVVGIAGHGDIKGLGKIGLKTFVYFQFTTVAALTIGLIIGNVFKPGLGFNIDLDAVSLGAVQALQGTGVSRSIVDLVVNMVPTSFFRAMADGNLLQIVVFSIFFALAICAVGEKARPVLTFLQSTCEIMFKFTGYVMLFAPLGVFGAIAATIGQNGIGILGNYAYFIVVTYLALAVYVIFVLVTVCKIVRVPFLNVVRAMKDPTILAFTTASSEAALPKAMETMEKIGAPKNIVGFVVPTGYTFNLDGSALYLALATLFCAQIAGVHLSIEQQLMIMATLMITSNGIAGVPRVSLVILAGTLIAFDLPLVGVAIILGIDQILDMGRTTVNLIGNCVASVAMARWENEFDDEKMRKFFETTGGKKA
jgi:proton glutamate symport protein